MFRKRQEPEMLENTNKLRRLLKERPELRTRLHDGAAKAGAAPLVVSIRSTHEQEGAARVSKTHSVNCTD